MMDNRLTTEICGIRMDNPTVLASGFLGTSVDLLKRVVHNGAGAVTPKSIGFVPKSGHPNPTIVPFNENTIVNAVGLPTPGYKDMMPELARYGEIPVPVIASIYGSSPDEYATIANFLNDYDVDIIELNISCPHRGDGILFGADPDKTREVVRAVKAVTKKPVMPKLTPNCDCIVDIALACKESGADALCAVNTYGPEPIRVPGFDNPVPGFGKGGLSGPALLNTTLGIIRDIYSATGLPILGMGGVTYGADAIEMIKNGAVAVGIGSAIYYRDMDVFKKVCNEMIDIMDKQGIKSIKDIQGGYLK